MNAVPLSVGDGWRYGLPGLPLAFAALPRYVHLPHHYASQGVPLATLGGVLLLARAFDALTDPWLGRWLDGVFRSGPAAVLRRAWPMAL
ncbi:MAG: MFS transporter, partial [Tepidimonas sp.]